MRSIIKRSCRGHQIRGGCEWPLARTISPVPSCRLISRAMINPAANCLISQHFLTPDKKAYRVSELMKGRESSRPLFELRLGLGLFLGR